LDKSDKLIKGSNSVGLFGGKKGKESKEDKEARQERIRRGKEQDEILKAHSKIFVPSAEHEPVMTSREYRAFKKIESRKKTWYELLAGAASKFITVKPRNLSRNFIIDGMIKYYIIR